MSDPLHPEHAPEPDRLDDDFLAWKLRDMADRAGFSLEEGRAIEAKFRRGRAEIGDDLTTVDLLGEAMEEGLDAYIYPALKFLFTDDPRLAVACLEAFRAARVYCLKIARCRELETALLACSPPEPL